MFTLVSLTRCNLAGYLVLLKGHKCTISDLHRTVLGQIPLTGGLYKHKYAQKATETANATQKVLSINDLHQCMGHISLGAMKALVKSGSVMGLDLDMSSELSFCKACAKVKVTCNPVPKEHNDPHAATVGEKVYSDVWGPSMPQSYDGKDYLVSFTDDHSCWSHESQE